ncbi:hypothetical protein [Oribacterium sp. P6A1]|uniref:hypothetical protein n=1 Tax=Oribacterium sp. P6A1 TaxID=1410612 RepID=UPI0012DCC122|nr:hypothetical protein [Oribacterium sp. P6A1]
MKNLLDAVSESYEETGELKQTVTGGKESDEAHERICSLGCGCGIPKVSFPYS